MKKKFSLFMIWILLIGILSGCSPADLSDDTGSTQTSQVSQTTQTSQTAQTSDSADDLTVHFLDVGQGDCTVITQGEHAMMIDAGNNDKGTTVQAYLNYLGIDTLDYVILTHPDADHIGGADVVIYKFNCGTILMPDKESDTKTYDDVIQAMKSKDYKAVHPTVGDTYEFGDASFTVLSPARSYTDTNSNSIVIRLVHGDNSFLFTGDAEEEAEEAMLASGYDLHADVLKAGHHGSRTSTSDEFLEAVFPTCAVISCGEGNKYGHPHAETLNKFRQAGITVYRTDEQGTITATSDGSIITWNTSPSDSWQTGEATASSTETATGTDTENATDTGTYILNTRSKKFHLPDCSGAASMADSNKEERTVSRSELISEGYEPCGKCNP